MARLVGVRAAARVGHAERVRSVEVRQVAGRQVGDRDHDRARLAADPCAARVEAGHRQRRVRRVAVDVQAAHDDLVGTGRAGREVARRDDLHGPVVVLLRPVDQRPLTLRRDGRDRGAANLHVADEPARVEVAGVGRVPEADVRRPGRQRSGHRDVRRLVALGVAAARNAG